MAVKEKFVLSWNDYSKNVCSALQDIRQQSELFDITLAVENKQIHAHKLVLAASSTFFRSVIKNNPHQHPLFYLKGVKLSSLAAILNFMYFGEVSVAQDELTAFLNVAEDLKVSGLTQDSDRGTTESQTNNSKEPAPGNTKENSTEIKVSKVINTNKRTKPVEPAAVNNKRSKPSTSETEAEILKQTPSTSNMGRNSPAKKTVSESGTKRKKLRSPSKIEKETSKSEVAALADGLSKNERIPTELEIAPAPGVIRRSSRKTRKTYKVAGSDSEESPEEHGKKRGTSSEDSSDNEVNDDDDEYVETEAIALKSEITFTDTPVDVGNIPEIPELANDDFHDPSLFEEKCEGSSEEEMNETNDIIKTLNEALDDLTKDYVTQVGSKDWKCLSCSKLFYQKLQSQTHVESDHLVSQGHVCPTCFTQFPTIKAVKDHVLAGHKMVDDNDEEDEVQCEQDIPLVCL